MSQADLTGEINLSQHDMGENYDLMIKETASVREKEALFV
jgi:hypothetical protein